MGWREDRRSRGWKQQLVWLHPECVQKLNNWKEASGKSYQTIINEVIANYDLPVETEQTQLERRIMSRAESLVEQKWMELQRNSEHNQRARDEGEPGNTKTLQLELPGDLQGEDKAELLNLIKNLREKEGKTFQDIAEYLNSQGIKACINKK